MRARPGDRAPGRAGVSAFGVDLSPKMIELARHAYPHLRFTELHRALAPGGHLLWGDYVGDGRLRPTHGYGRPVSYESYLLPLDHMAGLLEQAGLVVTAKLEQEPGGRANRPHACLLARKPAKT